jgi:hypothetical protein
MDGAFKLEGLNASSFLLKLSSLGLKDTILTVVHTGQDAVIDLGTIAMRMSSNNNLSEINVSNKTPLFENDGEKVKINVENTSLSASGSVMDILRKSPGVLVSGSDHVSVFGKGGAVIYLDGQLIASMDVLNTLPSNEIKSIEIISNPSAKYDAAGRAVINITTKHNALMGYNGTIWGNVKDSRYLMSACGTNLNYKNRNHAIGFYYGLRKGTSWSSDDYIRKFKSNDTLLMVMNNHIYEKRKIDNLHFCGFSYTYTLDPSKTLNVRYNGFYNSTGTTTNNENRVAQNNAEVYALKTASTAHPLVVNQTASLNYTDKLDTLGSEFFAAFQYTNFYSHNLSNIQQRYITATNSVIQEKQNQNENGITIYTFQTDLDKAFTKNWTLSSGIKNSYTSKAGDVKFDNYNANAGEWIPDTSYYNGFSYKENILAGYSELKFKKNKLTIRAGLRGEQTHSDGFSKKLHQQIILRNYFNLFPNAYFSYDVAKDMTTAFTWSNRIMRPAFQDMDPFINYIDSLSSFQGNPFLKPEYNTSVEGSLIYKKEASLTFGYANTRGALNMMVDKLNDGSDAFVVSTKNLDRNETYSAGITIPYELSWWTTSNYAGYFLNTYTYKSGGTPIKNSKPLLYIYLYNEFRLKKIASLEITYAYASSSVDGIFLTKSTSNLSAVLKKTFMKDRLVCRLVANDILQTYIPAGSSNLPGYDIQFISRSNYHSYLLALNYKFGKLKVNDHNNKTIGSTETDRIKMGK